MAASALAKRFSERERFRFPPPIGEVSVVLAAQDEIGTLPYNIPLKQMDVKIGGNEIDRLRRWYRQGKLQRSRGLVEARFPRTATPRHLARLVRRGRLHNARFAAAVIVSGTRKDKPLEIRWDVTFPTLYQIRMLGLGVTPDHLRRGADGRALRALFPTQPERRFSAGSLAP